MTGAAGITATIFIRVETYWTLASGHLWWRRWSEPAEIPHGYMSFEDGRFDDWLVARTELDDELRHWSENQMNYAGDVLNVEWLDDEASRYVRDTVLELGPADAD